MTICEMCIKTMSDIVSEALDARELADGTIVCKLDTPHRRRLFRLLQELDGYRMLVEDADDGPAPTQILRVAKEHYYDVFQKEISRESL